LNREADLNQLNASFRNPPSLFTRGDYASHDAEHETEALLDAYVNHDNTPPFVAKTLIQRFVTSNPSPRYVKAVSTAFKTGKHNDFGAGKRGDLAARWPRCCWIARPRRLPLTATRPWVACASR
jgi:hypothetical protein